MITEAIAPPVTPHLYTEAEYLALEAKAETKHELVHGNLIEMAGESVVANDIANNLIFYVRLALRGQPFRVNQHDLKLRTASTTGYRYPNVLVRPIGGHVDSHIVHQALLTAEITSDNSRITDTVDKLHEYTALESLQCYLIISQTEPLVEIYERTADAGKWL
ncbi:MAG: Uma2 family endonuclease, partial [Rudanella sp.]|nr:Uma2 family endonuclease [Rudanella sp.]